VVRGDTPGTASQARVVSAREQQWAPGISPFKGRDQEWYPSGEPPGTATAVGHSAIRNPDIPTTGSTSHHHPLGAVCRRPRDIPSSTGSSAGATHHPVLDAAPSQSTH
jgi:hypothetical protein